MQLNPWQFIDYERTVPLSYHRQRMKGAVRTTRIYCRPVCPVKHPLTRNVTYYPTAAAAEAAGYRPCLRCRPETAPFCPAWNGTRSTVARALKLIDGGALERGSVDALAEKLGITSRHLARLFERHVGASPQQVATTRRVLQSLRPLTIEFACDLARAVDMREASARQPLGQFVARMSGAIGGAVVASVWPRPRISLRSSGLQAPAIRSPFLTIFWHCSRLQNSSRKARGTPSRQRTVNGFG